MTYGCSEISNVCKYLVLEVKTVLLQNDRVDDITRSLILALGVCYHACLKTRPQYRAHIARHFRAPCQLPGGEDQIEEEIKW